MDPAANKVLDGLLEGLLLNAIEEEPSHGYGLIKELEAALGEEPSKNRVYRVLRDLEEEGYLASEEVTEASRTRQVYSLTDEGAQRLTTFRDLPAPFKAKLAGLFGIQADASAAEPARADGSAPDQVSGEGWVQQRLADLPEDAPVQARHAEYALERSPGEARWRFVVERHDLGSYEGSEDCPLTFVYLAIHRLLYGPSP